MAGMLTRTVNRLGDVAVNTVKKRPVAVAAVLGTGYGLHHRSKNQQLTERQLMNQYLGKYAALNRAMARIKTANDEYTPPSFGTAVRANLASGVGRSLAEPIVYAGNALRNLLVDKAVYRPQRAAIVKDLVAHDPIIGRAELENPGNTMRAFQTMARFAPMLSTDPNAVASFLRNTAMTGGVLDYKTVEGLASAEWAITRVANPLMDITH